AVRHTAPARVGRARRYLKIVPMLDDLAVFETKQVKANLRSEKIVLRVREDEVFVSERSHHVHARRAGWQLCEHLGETGDAVGLAQVVLNELVRIDHRARTLIA